MKSLKGFTFWCSLFWTLLSFTPAQELQIPALTGPVIDEASLLSLSGEREISRALKAFQQQYGPQIQVLTLNSLDGVPLEEATIRIVDAWKLGSASGDNGVLFLIAKKERQMRIEVGQGLEGMLTDAKSGRILDLSSPYFAKGEFDLGVSVALNAIMGQLGDPKAKMVPVASKKQMDKNPRGLIFFVILFFFLIFGGRGRRRRSWFLYGGSGRIGGRGGLGGGWSGGGGGFSGGGASGRW